LTRKELETKLADMFATQRATRKRYFEEEWGVAAKPKPKPKGGKNDLRIKTAYKTVKAATKEKNKIIGGDY